MTQKKRVLLLDSYRGFVIIHMVLFHLLYDINMVFEKNTDWYSSSGTTIWQRFICFSFIIVSGMVWSYGKEKSIKRGLLLNFWGLVISICVFIFLPSEAIWFGVLNLLGCCTLLTYALDRFLSRIPIFAGATLFLFLFFLFENIKIPSDTLGHVLLVPLGFPPSTFSSSDYFPLVPWFFLFLFGYYLNPIMEKTGFIQAFGNIHFSPLTKLGRYSLWVYLLHQPICYGICLLFFGLIK